jgi:hypothetical protein
MENCGPAVCGSAATRRERREYAMRRLTCSVCIAAVLLSLSGSALAVKKFKTSNYASGAQIWFEAEHFDERDSPNIYQMIEAEAKGIKLEKGAFGDAMTNARGQDGGWLLYRFDISKAGGKGGDWYFWGRVVNPSNQSDWLWVVGVDGPKGEIPRVKPAELADAGNAVAHAKNRIFEANAGPPWQWDGGTREGHRHKLLDGENIMMIFWRQSNATDQWDVFMWTNTTAYRPTDDDYRNAKEGKQQLAVQPTGKTATAWGSLKQAAR